MPVLATQVRLRFQLPNGVIARPGFWVAILPGTSPVLDATRQSIADDTRAAVVSSGLMAGFTNGTIFQEVEVQNFHVAPPGSEEPPPNVQGKVVADTTTLESAGADVAGSLTEGALPPNNAVVWSYRSAVPGPKGRGRLFLPATGDLQADSLGLIESTRQAQLFADMGTIVTAAVTAGAGTQDLVVVSRKHDEVNLVQTTLINAYVRSQRSRYTT